MARILVVDDEESLLELVKAVLEREGYEVLTASSGAEALETLEREEVDLVLLDVMMPEMDGWEVLREMKSRSNLRDISVAMLTVKNMSPHYFYSKEVEGLVDYINKPFSKKDLLERIREILEERRRIEAIREGRGKAPSKVVEEYEEILRSERLYRNLLKSLEFSLSKMDVNTRDYKLVKDAINYGKLLVGRIREKKQAYEQMISQSDGS